MSDSGPVQDEVHTVSDTHVSPGNSAKTSVGDGVQDVVGVRTTAQSPARTSLRFRGRLVSTNSLIINNYTSHDGTIKTYCTRGTDSINPTLVGPRPAPRVSFGTPESAPPPGPTPCTNNATRGSEEYVPGARPHVSA